MAHYHFPRIWAGRNADDVVVFANGHVYDRAERRRSLRQLVRMMRREKRDGMADLVQIEKERALVAELRTMNEADALAVVSGGPLDDVALRDQIKAATAETASRRDQFMAVSGMCHHVEVAIPLEARLLLLAAVVRCGMNRCDHATRGDRPLMGFLAASVSTCRDCEPRFGDLFAEADDESRSRVGRGRLCDLCLEEPDNFSFKPFSVQLGPMRLIGDLCGACARLFGIPR